MEKNKYIVYGEQFKYPINDTEIRQIEDDELRKIRLKYWGKRHKAFQDEHGVSDRDIGKVFDNILEEEHREIDEYVNRRGLQALNADTED